MLLNNLSSISPYFCKSFEKRGNLVPVVVTVTRNGKIYKQTVYKKPSKPIKLSKLEEWAIKSYQSSESYKINDALRHGEPLSGNLKEVAKHLDSALKKLPPHIGHVRRELIFTTPQDAQSLFDKVKEGQHTTFKEYLSCSQGNTSHFEGEATVEITIPNCSKGKNIGNLYNNFEKEILYPRNSSFFCEKITEENGKYKVTLKEI